MHRDEIRARVDAAQLGDVEKCGGGDSREVALEGARREAIGVRDLVGAPLAALYRGSGALVRAFPVPEQRFIENDRLGVVRRLQADDEAARGQKC